MSVEDSPDDAVVDSVEPQQPKEYVVYPPPDPMPPAVKGVNWHKLKGKWLVRHRRGGKTYIVGYFDEHQAAVDALNEYLSHMAIIKRDKSVPPVEALSINHTADQKKEMQLKLYDRLVSPHYFESATSAYLTLLQQSNPTIVNDYFNRIMGKPKERIEVDTNHRPLEHVDINVLLDAIKAKKPVVDVVEAEVIEQDDQDLESEEEK